MTKRNGERLAIAIKEVIQSALRHHGTTFRNYQDADGKMGITSGTSRCIIAVGSPVHCWENAHENESGGTRHRVLCPLPEIGGSYDHWTDRRYCVRKKYGERLFGLKGHPVFDADRSGWHVEEKGSPCLARLAKRFGEKILMADGRLDRTRLAALAFSSKEATQDLNAIVHGAIKEERDAFYAFIRTTASWSLTPPSFLKDTGKAYVMKFGLFYS